MKIAPRLGLAGLRDLNLRFLVKNFDDRKTVIHSWEHGGATEAIIPLGWPGAPRMISMRLPRPSVNSAGHGWCHIAVQAPLASAHPRTIGGSWSGCCFPGVRCTPLSRPSSLAVIMSIMPCAIAADDAVLKEPRPIGLDRDLLEAHGFSSTSAMISAMSLKDRSSGPAAAMSSSAPAVGAMSSLRGGGRDVAGRSVRRSDLARPRQRQDALLADLADMAKDVVHEGWQGEAPGRRRPSPRSGRTSRARR